jgi:hypothetical protein
MLKNSYSSAAAPTPHERALLLQVTALQFEKSALLLELKTLKEQQETFLNEVETEIEAQKSESLAAATSEIQNLQLQRRQATEAAAKEINQLQLQLKQATETLKDRDAFVSKLLSQDPRHVLQTSSDALHGNSKTSEDFAALELRLAVALEATTGSAKANLQLRKELDVALEANIGLTQANVQLKKELIDTLLGIRHQTSIDTPIPAALDVSSQMDIDSKCLAVQFSASNDVRVTENSSQAAHVELLSRIRVENFREIILRNFCYRIAKASSSRIFRRWKYFVKKQVHSTLQKTFEAELSELTNLHRMQQLQLDTFQASDTRAVSLLWRFREKIGNSKIFASSRKVLRCLWKCWLRRIRIRRRLQTYAWRNKKKCFMLWTGCARHQRTLRRTLQNLVQRKQQIFSQKLISSWKHEALAGHIMKQQYQVQQAAEKFITMHETQNEAVSAIKQTCSQMMIDLELVTSERNRFLSLFLSCEGKLLALVCFYRANSSRRYLFQIWKRKLANRKNVIRLQNRLKKHFTKRTLLIWYFDSRIRILNDFHEKQISESIENLELERETTGAALLNTEDELAETLSHLDGAILEIEQLRHINSELGLSISHKTSQNKDCEIQTNAMPTCQDNDSQTEVVSDPLPAIAGPHRETRDNEAQTEPAVNST